MSPIKIFLHKNNNINRSIIFFQPEHSKHNTNMTQNYPFWFCGERKLSRYKRGLGDVPGIPDASTAAGAAAPTHAHGSHIFGPLQRDNAGWSSSPALHTLQTCLGAGVRSHRADNPQGWTSHLISNRPSQRGDNRGKTRICPPLLSAEDAAFPSKEAVAQKLMQNKDLEKIFDFYPISP